MNRDFTEIKQQLLTLKDEYSTRIAKIEDHIHNPQDELNEHWDDQAISMRDNEMRKTLLLEAKHGLTYVNAALSRIESGNYGECEVCGEEIEDQRLKAVPYATLCIKHAS